MSEQLILFESYAWIGLWTILGSALSNPQLLSKNREKNRKRPCYEAKRRMFQLSIICGRYFRAMFRQLEIYGEASHSP